MRRFMHLVVVIAISQIGCTHLRLQQGTVNQANTVTDLQYQQVLDNLAMFQCNPNALPSHVKLKGGTVQAVDLRGGTIAGILGGSSAVNGFAPSFSAQQTVLGQWDVEPVVDTDDLEMLQLAYQKVTQPDREGIDQEIRFQIWTLAVGFQFALDSDTLIPIMKDAVAYWFKELQEKLDFVAAAVTCDLTDAKAHLRCAEEALVNLIQLQSLEEIPLREADASHGTAAYLARLSDYLRTKPDLRTTNCKAHYIGFPELSPDELEYAAQFDLYIEEFLTQLQSALAHLRQVGCETKRLKEVKNWIRYMSNEGELRKAVAGLNSYGNLIQKYEKQSGNCCTSSCNSTACDCVEANSQRSLTELLKEERIDDVHANAVRFLDIVGSWHYFISQIQTKLERRNPGLSDQAQTKVDKLKELYDGDSEFVRPWYHVGCKKDVPRCACYVGYYRGCGGERYVWVMPEDVETLSKFTVLLNSLGSLERQDSFAGRGASFSPGLR